MKCAHCENTFWVCEDHQDKAWKNGDGCCGGAGMLCLCCRRFYEHIDDFPKALTPALKQLADKILKEFEEKSDQDFLDRQEIDRILSI